LNIIWNVNDKVNSKHHLYPDDSNQEITDIIFFITLSEEIPIKVINEKIQKIKKEHIEGRYCSKEECRNLLESYFFKAKVERNSF